MSISDVFELDLLDYLEFYKDAIIYNNMGSKEGMARLDDAWILEQTKPDRNALRECCQERRSRNGR